MMQERKGNGKARNQEMESKLKRLFDFQKFQGNKELAGVIDAVHARYASNPRARELSMDELELVNAAGSPHYLRPKKEQEKDRP